MSEIQLIVDFAKDKSVQPHDFMSIRGVEGFKVERLRPEGVGLTHFRDLSSATQITIMLSEVTVSSLQQITALFSKIAFWVND